MRLQRYVCSVERMLHLFFGPSCHLFKHFSRRCDWKVKKKDDDLALEMERTDDILAYLGTHKTEGQFLCGFSMETENMLENSRKKLKKKNLDMIIANSLKMEGAGFGGNTNVVTVITEDFEKELGKLTKEETADRILDQILAQRGEV